MSGDEGSSHLRRYTGRVLEGLAAISHLPGGQYILLSAKELSKSTQFGIKDLVSGSWLLRLDKAHKGVNHAHININAKLTGVRDPHTWVPNTFVSTIGAGGKVLHAVGSAATLAAVAVDAYRLGADVTEDICKDGRLGKRTGETAASIGGGWAGGFGGSAAGNVTGAWLGSSVGLLFGGVGAVPGAAVGSLLGAVMGGMYGSIYGSMYGSKVTEVAVKELVWVTPAITTTMSMMMSLVWIKTPPASHLYFTALHKISCLTSR